MPGCLEHTGVLSQLLRGAKVTYYSQFHLRISSGSVTSDWYRLKREIITGCTISATLFTLAMNMLVKSAKTECRRPVSISGVRQPPIRAYMDDLTVTTSSMTRCRWLLHGLERHIKWARMTFKSWKYKLVVLKRGMLKKYHFTIEGKPILLLADGPVNLGKWLCKALHDKPAIEKTRREFESWMARIDKCRLPGRFKAWLYHHSVLLRLIWPLQVYSVPISIIEKLEKNVSSFFH